LKQNGIRKKHIGMLKEWKFRDENKWNKTVF
jgi:hypothetical protein